MLANWLAFFHSIPIVHNEEINVLRLFLIYFLKVKRRFIPFSCTE